MTCIADIPRYYIKKVAVKCSAGLSGVELICRMDFSRQKIKAGMNHFL